MSTPFPLRSIILAVLLDLSTAVMLILAFHPYNQWYLSWIALVPMLPARYLLLPLRWCGLATALWLGW